MSAKVSIGVDDTQLQAGMSRATNSVRKFASDSESASAKAGAAVSKAFAFAGGLAAVHQLGFAVKNLLSEFDDIADAATKLGTTAESFQRIKLQAELAGASADGLTTALLKMEAGLQRGGAEGEKLNNALASLKINATEFAAAAPEQKIALLAAAFQQARAEGRGLSEIQDLFKKQFTELIPLLSASSDELERLAKQKVVSDEDVARLAAANDALDAFVVSLKVTAGTSLASLMEQFESIDNTLKSITSNLAGVKEAIGFITNPAATAGGIVRDAFGKVTGKTAGAEGAPELPAPPVIATAPTFTGSIPGLEAAGVNPAAITIPGVSAATGPQAATADRNGKTERNAGNASKFAAEQLEALKRNNEILAQLASYQ